MSVQGPSARAFDIGAIGLSALCLVHCLALPLLAAALPLAGDWARAEWVHPLFVAIAAPLSLGALWLNSRGAKRPPALLAMAAAGLALLLAGAFGGGLEHVLTVAGSLTLVAAHLWNWRRRHGEAACGDCAG
jgi:hypothetical protein